MKAETRGEARRRQGALFRSPERIEIAVTGISAAVLLQVVLTGLRMTDPAPDRFTIIAGCCAAFLCVAAGSLLARRALRIACLLLLFLDCLMVLSAFGGRSLGAELLLLLLLEVSVSLRFPLPIALAADAAVLGFATLVGVSLAPITATRCGLKILFRLRMLTSYSWRDRRR